MMRVIFVLCMIVCKKGLKVIDIFASVLNAKFSDRDIGNCAVEPEHLSSGHIRRR